MKVLLTWLVQRKLNLSQTQTRFRIPTYCIDVPVGYIYLKATHHYSLCADIFIWTRYLGMINFKSLHDRFTVILKIKTRIVTVILLQTVKTHLLFMLVGSSKTDFSSCSRQNMFWKCMEGSWTITSVEVIMIKNGHLHCTYKDRCSLITGSLKVKSIWCASTRVYFYMSRKDTVLWRRAHVDVLRVCRKKKKCWVQGSAIRGRVCDTQPWGRINYSQHRSRPHKKQTYHSFPTPFYWSLLGL